ncbi:MAG: hypothetical protein KBD01_17720 [Acidobacteria bacterium]|nr:hypothetical protein [Acidobacteriota bacterium]
MSRHALVVAFALCFASVAAAGEMYGKITEGATAVPAGVAVQVDCGGQKAEAKTDKTGSYHLVAANGKCTLTVAYKDQKPSIQVVSYDEGAQVDLVLELAAGKYTLRRK